MQITAKTYVLLALSITCLFLNWQGISAPSEMNHSEADITAMYPPALSKNYIVNQAAPDVSGAYADIPAVNQPQIESPVDFAERWLAERLPGVGDPVNFQVIVAVLDTGIDSLHEDLIGTVISEVNMTESPEITDVHGHGTHIAGIITANVNNELGVNGIAPDCLLLNVKVADDKGRCRASDLAEGIIWSVDRGAHIINISIEIREYSSALKEAVDYAWSNGALVIAAAGNDGSNVPVFPAGYDKCISVTALKNETAMAPLANYGSWIDVAAPGYQVYSTLPGDAYGYKHGTSFATAYVTGLAAELYQTVTDTNANGQVNDELKNLILALCSFNLPDQD